MDPTLKRARELVVSGQQVNTGRANLARFFVKKGLLYREYTFPKIDHGQVFTQLVVPQKFRNNVMVLAHDSILGGHLGAKKTYDKIATQFYWPGIYGDVVHFCCSCDVNVHYQRVGLLKYLVSVKSLTRF